MQGYCKCYLKPELGKTFDLRNDTTGGNGYISGGNIQTVFTVDI